MLESVLAPSTDSCPICGHPSSQTVLVKNGYTLARCAHCHTVRVCPIPSNEFLREHYQDPAYFDGKDEQGYRNYADVQKALLPHFQRRLRSIEKQIPKGHLLDFGCAAGYFLQVARAANWEITGIELAHEMAQRAAQLVQAPVVSSLDAISEKNFDAITLWEVIEHLPQPVTTLRQLHDSLRPGGMLMLSTPNTGHWQAIREPDLWLSYRPPSHLFYFTARTLEETLSRAGFERISIHRVMPLPPLPRWLRQLSTPLQRDIIANQAKSWRVALLTWRIIRVFGWGWQKIAHPDDDIFTTLEARAFRSKAE
jgi:2-polyprenyl-3-methyl-5-hydroxy-6-metoxy-1,4-benzoquinol methylase